MTMVSDPGTANEKSPEAFRTISELAAELGVEQHVLRFWEGKFPEIKPVKRGGGRRYYRPQDVSLVKGIHALLKRDGYTIKGVQKLMRENGQRFIADQADKASKPATDAASPANPVASDGPTQKVAEDLRALASDLRAALKR